MHTLMAYSQSVCMYYKRICENIFANILILVVARNELASLTRSFYTYLKHQLMHQLYSSPLPQMMLGSTVLLYLIGHVPACAARPDTVSEEDGHC